MTDPAFVLVQAQIPGIFPVLPGDRHRPASSSGKVLLGCKDREVSSELGVPSSASRVAPTPGSWPPSSVCKASHVASLLCYLSPDLSLILMTPVDLAGLPQDRLLQAKAAIHNLKPSLEL